jgi:large-conductance mechanosensitive channel
MRWIEQLSVAGDTKKLLKELVERKEKEMNLKFRLYCLSAINGFNIIMVIFWLVKLHEKSLTSVFGILDYVSSSKASVIFLVLAISLFIYTNYVSKEYKKKKDKYDNLREEVSRKISASWKITEDSKVKDEISEVLKSRKDINIRYMK